MMACRGETIRCWSPSSQGLGAVTRARFPHVFELHALAGQRLVLLGQVILLMDAACRAVGCTDSLSSPRSTWSAQRGRSRWLSVMSRASIGSAVLYFESASFVTGEILHVDGGQSAEH